jgi:hypothetical protein
VQFARRASLSEIAFLPGSPCEPDQKNNETSLEDGLQPGAPHAWIKPTKGVKKKEVF